MGRASARNHSRQIFGMGRAHRLSVTQARTRIAGTTIQITRSVSERRFLLCPSAVVECVILFCLHAAALKFDIAVHAVTVMSNHIHVVVTVPHEFLSDFTAWFHRHVGCCLLDYYRRRFPTANLETLWSAADKTQETILTNKAAILKALVYGFLNPVEAGLVHDYRKWPGVLTRPRDWLRTPEQRPVHKRPAYYFKPDGVVPTEVTARYTIPFAFADEDPDDFVLTVEAMLRDKQAKILREREGRPFLGVKAILRTDPLSSPSTPRKKGKIIPKVAAGGDTALLRRAKRFIRYFNHATRLAWRTLKETGSAVFPPGTYLMHHRYGMPREESNFDWCLRAPPS